MITPVVAIWMITYNHEDYIVESVTGIVNQITNFPIQLFIGEDCSTDNTRNICLSLKEKYSDRITLLLNPYNNIVQNSKNVYNACLGSGASYIAMCEGDDYWIDPLKLQKQVDFLENNKDFSMCFHPVYENVNGKIRLPNNPFFYREGDYTIEDLAKGNFISTLSVLFRKNFEQLPDWFLDCPIGDYPLHLLNGQYGKYKALIEPMAVYRYHSGGMHSMKPKLWQLEMLIKTVRIIKSHFNKEVQKSLVEQCKTHFKLLINSAYLERDFETGLKLIKQAVLFDEDLSNELLFDTLPAIIQNIYSTNRYKTGDKIARILKTLSLK